MRKSEFAGVLFLVASLVFVPLLGGQTRTAAPNETPVANLPTQPIGANDLIAVAVYDAPELSRTVRVGADGFIRLPMLKQRLKAQGLMPGELEGVLAHALQEEQLIVEPFVTVTVAEYNSRPISVAGAVKQPLTFQAAGPVSLLEAITRAGGLSPEAGPEILLSRSQTDPGGTPASLVQRIPVKGLISGPDTSFNVALHGGEEIRVPEVGRVYVIGNVKRPGAFAIQDGTDSSVLKVLALSEGLAPYAGNEAFVYRREGNGSKNEIPIPLKDIMNRKASDVPLVANDILYVPDAKGRRATLAALEKILLFGTGATTASIYAGVR